jgi:hypothetical protein
VRALCAPALPAPDVCELNLGGGRCTGRGIVITGASSGIGEELAYQYAKQGSKYLHLNPHLIYLFFYLKYLLILY